jgi:hypothetical protein
VINPVWLARILGAPEEVNGANRCPTYLYRWFLLRTRWFKVYLHHFVGDDWSLDLHDHPKRFISIGLKGEYMEQRPFESGVMWKHYRAPWFRTFPAAHIHRISMIDGGDCWTLVIVLRVTREWGFWHMGEFIHWRRYVMGDKRDVADKMTACGGER